MRNVLFSLAAVFATLATPGFAQASDATDQTAAIRLCRAEVAAQSGVEADTIRFDQVRVRRQAVRVDFDLWRNGQLQNVRCEVARGEEGLRIASITPTLQAVAAR